MAKVTKANRSEPKQTIQSQTKNFFAGVNLSQKQRVILATCLSVLVIFSAFWIYTNGIPFFGNKKTQPTESKLLQDPDVQRELRRLQDLANTVDPQKIVYEKIKFEDLPVYPIGWVSRYFTPVESRNTLISGPSADFDQDGLTNKQEFFYGSNPKNKFTSCIGKKQTANCRTDYENVQAGISPLTGLRIEPNREIITTKQDITVLESIQDSFERSSNEGVDFPSLYQNSLTLDLTSDLNKIVVTVTEDNRQTFVEYIKFRLEILKSFLNENKDQSGLTTLISIYNLSKPEELNKESQKYRDLRVKMQNYRPPSTFERSHKAFILLFDKLINLIEHRKLGIANKNTASKDYLEKSKKYATEVVWAYRIMNEELQKIQD